jgi:hypothetical protein
MPPPPEPAELPLMVQSLIVGLDPVRHAMPPPYRIAVFPVTVQSAIVGLLPVQ